MDPPSELLEAGGAALAAGDWDAARRAFEGALERDAGSADALFGLGSALWWTREVADGTRLWERAYAGFRRRPDPVQAVLVAVNLSLTYNSYFGNRAAARGWAARAERVAADLDVPPLAGWVLITKANVEDDPAAAQASVGAALEIARDCGDTDLELCALAALGQALVDEGRHREGQPLLDEAMAGSLGGEVENLDTVVFTSCLLVQACYRCGDFSRVVQWVHALGPFVEQFGSPYLNSVCRAHYGAVLVATGDWSRAEEELEVALDLAGDALPGVQAEARSYLAELRLAQGRTEEAGRLLEGFEDYAVAAPVLASVQLARDEPAAAANTAGRVIAAQGRRYLHAARAREVLGDAHLLLDQPDPAREHAEHLVALGHSHGCDLISARGARLRGRVAATGGRAPDARRSLDEAVVLFAELEMPLEVARTRVALAHALEDAEPAAALDEGRRALATFEGLGATRDADATAAWLREHGVTTRRRGGTADATLTPREREVLDLLGEGLTNPEIADRLYLSRRTVEHHVASVLSKLGLRNRTEAAAHALRRDVERQPGEEGSVRK